MRHLSVIFSTLCILIGFSEGEKPRWEMEKDRGCISTGYKEWHAKIAGGFDGTKCNDWKCVCQQTKLHGGIDRNCSDISGQIWAKVWGKDHRCKVKASPKWGKFVVGECIGKGIRKYTSTLENVPVEHSLQAACQNVPAAVNNQTFKRATRCNNTGTYLYGEFNVSDISCDWDYGVGARPATEDHLPRVVKGPAGIPLCENCDDVLREWNSDGCSDKGFMDREFHSLFHPACIAHDFCAMYAIHYSIFGTKDVDTVTSICADVLKRNTYRICDNITMPPGISKERCYTAASFISNAVNTNGIIGFRASDRTSSLAENMAIFKVLLTKAVLITSMGKDVVLESPQDNYDIRIHSTDMSYFYTLTSRGTIDVFKKGGNQILYDWAGQRVRFTGSLKYGKPASNTCSEWRFEDPGCLRYKAVLSHDGKIKILSEDNIVWSHNVTKSSTARVMMWTNGSIVIRA